MDRRQAASSDRLTNGALAAFTMPMLPIMAVELAWRIYLPAHFTTVVGLPLAAAGVLLMAARVFDSLIDPVIAWASDRFPTRWGHRRPWMVLSLVPLMTGAAFTFFAWPGMNWTALACACLLLHLGLMLLVTPHGGWAMELGRSTDQRMRIMLAKTWFPMAGAVLLVMLPAYLEREWQADARVQTAALGMLLLLLAPLAVSMAVGFVSEPAVVTRRTADRSGPFALFRDLLRTPAMRPILLFYFVSGLADAACATIFLLFVTHGLALPGWGSTLLLLQSLSTLIALPLWYRVGARTGPGRLLTVAYAWMACLSPVALLLPSGDIASAAAFVIARGLVGGIEFMVLRVLVAEVAGQAADAGRRQGAGTYAVSNITLKLAMGAGAWLALVSVGWIDPDAATADWAPDADQASAIRLCFMLPMLCCGGIGIALLGLARAQTPFSGRRRGIAAS